MERDKECAAVILEASVNASNQGLFDSAGSRIGHTCSLVVVVFLLLFPCVHASSAVLLHCRLYMGPTAW